VGTLGGKIVSRLSMFALAGMIALVPGEAPAQFPIPIPLPFPHIDVRPRPPAPRPAPSHHSGAREECDRGNVEKDATEEQRASSPTDTHQQQEQASTPAHPGSPPDGTAARKNNADNPPVFAPTR
jgi:hypothetical protein